MDVESVGATTTPAGLPLRILWRGRTWHVRAQPVHWYERRNWWEITKRVPRETGAGIVDLSVWQLQLQLGNAGELRTVLIAHDEATGRWHTHPEETTPPQ